MYSDLLQFVFLINTLAGRADMLGFLSDAPANDQSINLINGFRRGQRTPSFPLVCDGTEKTIQPQSSFCKSDNVCPNLSLKNFPPKHSIFKKRMCWTLYNRMHM